MARHSQLVCRHLENVSRQALDKYQHIIRQYVRNCPGVYALYRRGKLYYVGLASNLPTRLGHHLKDRHSQSWDRFSVYSPSATATCESWNPRPPHRQNQGQQAKGEVRQVRRPPPPLRPRR